MTIRTVGGPAQPVVLYDSNGNPITFGAGGFPVVLSQAPSAALLANGITLPTTTTVGAASLLYNGSTLDLQNGNIEGIALASAVRAATTSSADITNYNGRALLIIFRITAVPGADTVTLSVEWKNPADGAYYSIGADSAQSTATTRRIQFGLAAGTGGNFDKTGQIAIPRTFRITVTHSAGTNFTYSVGYALTV